MVGSACIISGQVDLLQALARSRPQRNTGAARHKHRFYARLPLAEFCWLLGGQALFYELGVDEVYPVPASTTLGLMMCMTVTVQMARLPKPPLSPRDARCRDLPRAIRPQVYLAAPLSTVGENWAMAAGLPPALIAMLCYRRSHARP